MPAAGRACFGRRLAGTVCKAHRPEFHALTQRGKAVASVLALAGLTLEDSKQHSLPQNWQGRRGKRRSGLRIGIQGRLHSVRPC